MPVRQGSICRGTGADHGRRRAFRSGCCALRRMERRLRIRSPVPQDSRPAPAPAAVGKHVREDDDPSAGKGHHQQENHCWHQVRLQLRASGFVYRRVPVSHRRAWAPVEAAQLPAAGCRDCRLRLPHVSRGAGSGKGCTGTRMAAALDRSRLTPLPVIWGVGRAGTERAQGGSALFALSSRHVTKE